jgi:hypothetical protein
MFGAALDFKNGERHTSTMMYHKLLHRCFIRKLLAIDRSDLFTFSDAQG